MFFLYDLLVVLLSPLVAFVMLFYKRGRKKLLQRFGIWGVLPEAEYMWFHGASRGEVKGLAPLIKELRKKFPNRKVLLTTVSPSGLEGVETIVDYAKLIPFDSIFFLNNAAKKLNIKIFVAAEVELWPRLLKFINDSGAKMYLINARKPLRSYPWTHNLLTKYDKIFAGVKGEPYLYIGNTKYDQIPNKFQRSKSQEKLVVTLGSIRPGEEVLLFPTIKDHPQASFVIAPRHREKDAYFAARLKDLGIDFKRRTEGGIVGEGVLLLDTFGELEEAYSISNLVFIGGTLVEIGGHNPYEAAMYSSPIAVGAFTYKISDAVKELSQGGGLFNISKAGNWEGLLSKSPKELLVAGEKAYNVWLQHRGAAEKIAEAIASDQ